MKLELDYLPIRPLLICDARMECASAKHTRPGEVDRKGTQFQFDEHLRAALAHLEEHNKGSYDPDGTHFSGFVTRAILAFDALLDGRVSKDSATREENDGE